MGKVLADGLFLSHKRLVGKRRNNLASGLSGNATYFSQKIKSSIILCWLLSGKVFSDRRYNTLDLDSMTVSAG